MLPFGMIGRGSGREKVDRVQRGDDLTTDQQFLQIVAVAQFFIRQDVEPEVVNNRAAGVRFDHSRVQHAQLFSSGCARPPDGGNPKWPEPKSQTPKYPRASRSDLWSLGFGLWDFVR